MAAIEDFGLELDAQHISVARQHDHLRVLGQIDTFLTPRPLTAATADDLAAYLAHRSEQGCAPNTLRKERQMALSFFTWAHRTGHVDAEALMALRSIVSPQGATSRIRPEPYSARELRIFRAAINARWPVMNNAKARKFVARWENGDTPYPRIRKHAIRLQVDAVISLALHTGLRRREIFALHLDDMHYDNAYIVVWRGERWVSPMREVPFTDSARTAVMAWIEFRACMGVNHERPWLNLWAEKTAREPTKPDAFAKLLSSYVAPELNYRRLRHTCGIGWLKAGMDLWEVQRLLGQSTLKDALPYGEAIEVDLERRVERLQVPFANIVAPAA